MHRCVVNTVVVWLHILGPYWCILYCSAVECATHTHTQTHQQIPAYICSHTTTVLTTHRCILVDLFNNCNFSKHKLMRSLMMV